MKKINVLKFCAATALVTCVANVHAATAQLSASTIVTGTCAVVASISIPSGSAGNANNLVNVNCSSGTVYSVVLGVGNETPDRPASGVSETSAIVTVSY